MSEMITTWVRSFSEQQDKAKHRTAFRGSLVALITPMRRGRVEEEALARLVEWHVTCGTSGIVACGTTGESPTLTHEEHVRVIDVCVEAAAARVPVMVGTGSNATAEAVALTPMRGGGGERVGGDALLQQARRRAVIAIMR